MSVLTFDRVPSRFRERPRWLLPLVGVLAVLLVVEALGVLLPGPSGPPSSSYATASEGVAAYAELLQRERHSLSRVRGRLDATPLDPGSTLVILGPDVIVAPEARALRRFVAGGWTARGRCAASGHMARRSDGPSSGVDQPRPA